MRLKNEEQNSTSTTDLNNNCVKTDDHLVDTKQQVYLQLKRTGTEDGLNGTNLDEIELKEFNSSNNLVDNNIINNNLRTKSPIHRQPSPSQLSINHLNHSKCNGVCVITNEPKSCNKLQKLNSHLHLSTSHSNGTVASQNKKIQLHLNGNLYTQPSQIKSPASLSHHSTQPHSPLVPSYLSNSSKYTGYSTYGVKKLSHPEHLPNASSLCIDNLHTKTKIYNFKVVIVGDLAAGKTSYIRKLTQPKNGSRNRYNYYTATVSFRILEHLFEFAKVIKSFLMTNSLIKITTFR